MLSIQLASYYAHRGKSVALFSHNKLTKGFDIAIHDMPGAFGAEELRSIIGKHRLLIPVLPSPTDIKACVRFLMALNRNGLIEENYQQIGLIANRVNVRTNYFKVLLAFLNQVNLPLVGYLRDTQNYVRPFRTGISIFDLPRRSMNHDLCQWQSILDWLDHEEVEDQFREQITQIISPRLNCL
ncbi:MAG: chromosome partitioning protein [Flavobacterium sp.]|jgi:chromosome partitioning protein